MDTEEVVKPDWGLPHRHITLRPQTVPAGSKREDNGPVSRLQEWVQAQSKQGNFQRILYWSFEQQMEDRITLQFKATVSFVLDNVPHHIEGDWQTSKKKSQRDTAERALFHLEHLDSVYIPSNSDAPMTTITLADPNAKYTIEELDGQYRSQLHIMISSTPHYFRGTWQQTEEMAKDDVTRRTLGYLRVPQYHDAFLSPESEAQQPAIFDMKVAPDANYASRVAQQKTALMQVQNLLQKVYSKEIQPGQDMWEWHWESNQNGHSRVIVRVPVAQQSFCGDWCAGKKEAQRTTCERLKTFLEAKLKEIEAEALLHGTDGPHPQNRRSNHRRRN